MSTVITKDDAKELFKANIRDVLKERGMSQGDLARVLFDGDDCVNNRMKVSRWCNAAVSPTLWELANIAEALDIPIGRLFAARTNGRKKLSKK